MTALPYVTEAHEAKIFKWGTTISRAQTISGKRPNDSIALMEEQVNFRAIDCSSPALCFFCFPKSYLSDSLPLISANSGDTS